MGHPGGLCAGHWVLEVLPRSIFAASQGCLCCALSLLILPEGFLDVAVWLKLWTRKGKKPTEDLNSESCSPSSPLIQSVIFFKTWIKASEKQNIQIPSKLVWNSLYPFSGE